MNSVAAAEQESFIGPELLLTEDPFEMMAATGTKCSPPNHFASGKDHPATGSIYDLKSETSLG